MSGDELQRLRRAAGLTQAELADRLGVRLWMIDQWESGTRPIPDDRLEELAAATRGQPTGTPDVAPKSGDAAAGEVTRAVPDAGAVEHDPQLRPALVASTMEPVDDMWPPDPELPRALRGYEPAAVHALLGELAAARDQLVKDLNDAKTRAAQLEDQAQDADERAVELTGDVPDLRAQGDLIRDAIITAQRAANEVREEARQSASDVLESARHQAEQIIAEAEKERERLAEEISRLEQHAETSRVAVSEFLSSLLDQVRPEPAAEHDEADANLDEAIFEHEIGKVAEPARADTDSSGSKRSRSS